MICLYTFPMLMLDHPQMNIFIQNISHVSRKHHTCQIYPGLRELDQGLFGWIYRDQGDQLKGQYHFQCCRQQEVIHI